MFWDVLGNDGREALGACVKVYFLGGEDECLPPRFSPSTTFTLLDAKKDPEHRFSVIDIYDAVTSFNCANFDEKYSSDEKKVIQRYPEDRGPRSVKLKNRIEEQRFELTREYEEAKCRLQKYSLRQAERRVRECFMDLLQAEPVVFPIKEDGNQTYDVIDIYKMLIHFEKREFKNCGMFTSGFGNSSRARKDLEEEYLTVVNGMRTYSRSEAERRVKNCFSGTFPDYVDVFRTHRDKSGVTKSHQTSKNVEFKETCLKKQGNHSHFGMGIEQRWNASGFIVQDHFVITNGKFAKECLVCNEHKKIHISNGAIGDLPCEVAFFDAEKDLALLYCEDLKLNQNGIQPLQLSDYPLSIGDVTVSFGYPIQYSAEKAFVVNAKVISSTETSLGYALKVLAFPPDPGFCGSPALYRVNNKWKVVGVVRMAQPLGDKVSSVEREIIEKLGASGIPCTHDHNQAMSVDSLTLKLFDVLAACQPHDSYVLPGKYVIEFIAKAIRSYKGEGKEELSVIVAGAPWSVF